MATTSRSRLREMLGRATGFYFSGSLTTIGGAAGATLIDTKIARYNRNQMPDRWLYLTSGAISGESQRISTVSDDTVGTITPVRAFTAQVASGVTYEVLPWDPLIMHDALQQAIRLVNQYSPLSLVNETLVVDNLIANWDFEDYTSPNFASWTGIGATAPTLTQNTNYFRHGSNAANIADGGIGAGIEQDILIAANSLARIDQAVGKTLHVRGSLRTGASQKRLRVTFNGTTYTDSPDHDGDGDWERLAIDVAIPADPTEMTVSIESANTPIAAGYQADVVVAWIDPIVRYTVPTSFVNDGRLKVSQQAYEDKPRGDYRPISLSYPAEPGRILRLEGQGRLTVPTTDAGTTELDEAAAELVVAVAGRVLHRTLKNVGVGLSERHLQNELDWRDEVLELAAAMGLNKTKEFISKNRHKPWDMKDESGTNYLYLTGR